jgi:CRP-like cAMP-binding protein
MKDIPIRLERAQVATLRLFAELPHQALEAIARRCKVRRYAADEHVLHHHETSFDLFFVLDGRVRVVLYSPTGRDVSFRDLGPGEVFGELAAIDGGTRSASVLAIEPTALVVMSRADFIALTQTHPEVAQALQRHLVALIRRYSQRVYELSTLGVEQRIRAEIVRLACERGDGSSAVVIQPAPTLANIASLVGTTREAVSREIARLSREGLVQRRGNALMVLDVGRLGATLEDAIG